MKTLVLVKFHFDLYLYLIIEKKRQKTGKKIPIKIPFLFLLFKKISKSIRNILGWLALAWNSNESAFPISLRKFFYRYWITNTYGKCTRSVHWLNKLVARRSKLAREIFFYFFISYLRVNKAKFDTFFSLLQVQARFVELQTSIELYLKMNFV